MFETPSACLQADELLTQADFGSIGTNDLTQYTFAVDRDNEHMADDYHPDHPVIWTLLEQVVLAARRQKKPISVCGELAARPEHIGRLMALGVRTVSVSVRLIPALREAVLALGDEPPRATDGRGAGWNVPLDGASSGRSAYPSMGADQRRKSPREIDDVETESNHEMKEVLNG